MVLLVIGAAAVVWFGVRIAQSVRYGNFGPMIDNEGSLGEPLLPVISVAYLADVFIVAITLVGLAASRLVAPSGRSVRDA